MRKLALLICCSAFLASIIVGVYALRTSKPAPVVSTPEPMYNAIIGPTAEPTVFQKATVSPTKAATVKSYSDPFTNKFGTSTTICAYPGCSKYIASSGDTNCCTTHSNKCLNCQTYIDSDAAFCMACIEKALRGK